MQTDTREKLSPLTIALHWIVALFMIGLLASGIYMTRAGEYSIYPIHKSFGIIISAFVLVRVLWRIKNGWPKAVGDYNVIEKIMAKFAHYLLIIGTVVMPLSGMLMTVMSGRGLFVFGFELIAKNMDPANPKKRLPIDSDLASLFNTMHTYAAYIILMALALHIIGALKHHFVDKDATLKRMLGKS